MEISPKTRSGSAALVRPPERLKISEWADKYGWLPQEGNAEPGPYRLRRMPHEAEMLDDPIDPGVREIFWMIGSQLGKTFCLILICEFIICKLRKSLKMVRPTKDTAGEWLLSKFLPTVEATPCMKGLLRDPREKGSGSKGLRRKFLGGMLNVAGAKSPTTLRSSSEGYIAQDEIDCYEATKEGDPCALADRAAITFSEGCKLKASTPTLEGFSRIGRGYKRGDQRKYFLPCPCCGEFQPLDPGQMKFSFTAEEHERFDQGCDQATAAVVNGSEWELGNFSVRDTKRCIYVCAHCRRGWTDQQRLQAYWSGHVDNPAVIPIYSAARGQSSLLSGKEGDDKSAGLTLTPVELRAHWRATAVDDEGKPVPFNGVRSRHLNGMYTSIGLKPGMVNYLHQFSEEFLEAVRGGRETLMVRTNIFDALPYEDPHQKIDWKDLKKRAEDYWCGLVPGQETGALPEQVVWINFGLDVHPDRVEILFYGWGEGEECWALEQHIEYGDFDMPRMQDRVGEYLLGKKFRHPILGELGVSAGGLDSGHQTKVKAVFQFCAKYRLYNFWAIKGFSNALGSMYTPERERLYGGLRLNLNVDAIKTTVFHRIKNTDPGPRYVHFPKEEVELNGVKIQTGFDERFYVQLCSEKRITVKTGKEPTVQFELKWVKLVAGIRNEMLDCTVYAFGAYDVSRQGEWIARKWKEVQAKIRELNPTVPAGPAYGPQAVGPDGKREYVLKAAGEEVLPKEKKNPEVKPQWAPKSPASAGAPGKRRIRINSPFRKF